MNKLLGTSDVVNDLKLNFVHTLYTPRKLSVPHGHLIKDLMQPDRAV